MLLITLFVVFMLPVPAESTTIVLNIVNKPSFEEKSKHAVSPKRAQVRAANDFNYLGDGKRCHAKGSDAYLPLTSETHDSANKCIDSCRQNSACMAVTYFRNGFCSHFSRCNNPIRGAGGSRSYTKVLEVPATIVAQFDYLGDGMRCRQNGHLPQTSGKRNSEKLCIDSCRQTSACVAVTYFLSDFCSHFSRCDNPIRVGVSLRSFIRRTVPATTTTPLPAPVSQFDYLGDGNRCYNKDSGGAQLPQTSGKRDSVKLCIDSCRQTSACMAVTYFRNRFCSHFSRCDTRIGGAGGSRSYRKVSRAVTAPLPPPSTPIWQTFASLKCNQREVQYIAATSGPQTNAEECKASCKRNRQCVAATFWGSRLCSHYSAFCATPNEKAKDVISFKKAMPVIGRQSHAAQQRTSSSNGPGMANSKAVSTPENNTLTSTIVTASVTSTTAITTTNTTSTTTTTTVTSITTDITTTTKTTITHAVKETIATDWISQGIILTCVVLLMIIALTVTMSFFIHKMYVQNMNPTPAGVTPPGVDQI